MSKEELQENSLGPLMVDMAGTSLSGEDISIIQHPLVGGVILFTRNFVSRAQLVELVKSIREIKPKCVVAVDQEGGRVQRFKREFTRLPPMQVFDATGAEFARSLVVDTAWLMASELIACGIDISFAPVLDVDRDFSSIIGDRSFSYDPWRVSELAGAFIDGMREAGMAATGKHFPGHGGVQADSHLELPIDSRAWSELVARDFIPFKELSHKLRGVMPAHIVFSNIDEHPVGFSPKWLKQILRKEFEFNGVIFSDDLTMEGASSVGGYPERAFAALEAGCDVILICNNRNGVHEVLDALESSTFNDKKSNLDEMSARSTCEWSELISSNRYINTQVALAKLV